MPKPPDQLDLFSALTRAVAAEVLEIRAAPAGAFDFVADGDAAACVPRPEWVIPDWLRLPSDDPDWMPVLRIG